MPLSFLHKPALIVYVTCGDPDLETSREIILAAIDAGADVIELGVPFSDPLADGPVIQRASERALQQRTSLQNVIDLAAAVRRQRAHAGLIIFSYLNPIVRYGIKRFAGAASDAGIDGVLLTDMTVEESAEYRRSMHGHKLATIFLAAPTSPDDRLQRIADASSGFIYAVSRLGVTGAQTDLSSDAQELVARLRRFTALPIAVGFGVSNAEQFRVVGSYADAVVIGSAIVSIIEREGGNAAGAVGQFVRSVTGQRTSALGSGKL
ncbi:MAG: tryptophan synthase subunit alpha [Acidobacteriaceae bacterium]